MGEPMLHPQFDEVCRMFKETFPKCKLIVATNCQYNINDKFRECMKYIDMLYFSIDGYKESYERDRSPAKWSKLLKFLEQFKLVDRYDCDVVVNYVVNAYNVQDIEKIDDLRKEHNLGQLRLNIAQIWDADTKMSDDIATSGYTEEDLNYLRENWNEQIMGKSKWDFKDCFWVNNGIYTTVEGHVKMCCMNTGAEPFGNLFLNTIDEIREMEDYQNVKKGCQTNNPTSHCKNCSYKELTPILEYVGI
jgi:sulfatase maturation enzyme AslB (radical SAM superfamily)